MTIPTFKLTEAEQRAFEALCQGYREDTPAHVLGQTRRRADGRISISRHAAAQLTGVDLARYSRPKGQYLLLTQRGIQEAEAITGRPLTTPN